MLTLALPGCQENGPYDLTLDSVNSSGKVLGIEAGRFCVGDIE